MDAVLVSSISEAAQLPVMEAAAAGRLVIGTPVGHFPLKAYQGGGILAPIEAAKFKSFATATLLYYKDNPQEFRAKCRSIQEAAKQFDWKNSIGAWIELVEKAGAEKSANAASGSAAVRGPDDDTSRGGEDEASAEPRPHIVERTFTASPLAEKVETAFRRARAGEGKLSEEVLSMVGMSGRKYRLFVNNLIEALPDARYLEVGVWSGSTLCSAIYRNRVRSTAIDNWSQFDGPSEKLFENLARHKGPQASVSFIEKSFRDVDFTAIGKFNVYLFDGPHETQDQYDGINLALPALDDEFILIVDDWNFGKVRDGTFSAIRETKLSLRSEIEIRTTNNDLHPDISGCDSSWHNGYFIGVLSKHCIETK